MNRLQLAWRFAGRELSGGLNGFRIFFLSLALGVAAIAAVGSLSEAFLSGLAQQGRVLLGGDVSVALVHRTATPAERQFLSRYGRVSETASLRAMAYALKAGHEAERQLVELKAVDGAYPLYGAVALSPARDLASALACVPENGTTICGAVAEQSLFDRLHIKPGALVRVGTQTFRVHAVLTDEPDRISGGFSLGPHLMLSNTALARTGLVTIGSLIQYRYRVALAGDHTPQEFRIAALTAFPDAGWEIRDRDNAAPGTSRFIAQITMFLTLAGLTALAVGGVGAGQAIGAFLDRKRRDIAILKALGADGPTIFLVFFLQIMAIALAAVAAGLVAGAALPFAMPFLFAGDLPLPAAIGIYPRPLLLAFVFGILSAAVFGIPPLARAREIRAASLFRDQIARSRAHGRWPYLAAAGIAALAVIALALLIAPQKIFALEFLGGIAAGLAVLRLIAGGLRFLLRHLPPMRGGLMRMAIANLVRPGAATAGVITALGLGLTLLATVTLLDATITAQVRDDLPESAPSFFFVDIQPDEAARFDRLVGRFPTAADFRRTPIIRGRIVSLNGTPARDAKVDENVKWALNGDRGITYAATPPKGTEITQGQWWPPDYRGPTQISFDAEIARGMGLTLGDTLTLNVLGRELTGTITSLRDVNFTNGRQNFILILSPGIIDKAPHSFLATVHVAPAEEAALYRAVTDAFPNVSTVRVKDAIAEVNTLLQSLATGVRLASLLTILSGLLVLAGAIAIGQRVRTYDSTVLKVLGATRGRIAAIHAVEYAILGVLTGVLALAAGTLAAAVIAHNVFGVALVFDVRAALFTIAGGGFATIAMGIAGTWAALAARPAQQLRAP